MGNLGFQIDPGEQKSNKNLEKPSRKPHFGYSKGPTDGCDDGKLGNWVSISEQLKAEQIKQNRSASDRGGGQTNKQSDRHRDGQTTKQQDKRTTRQAERRTNRQTERRTKRRTNNQTNKERNNQWIITTRTKHTNKQSNAHNRARSHRQELTFTILCVYMHLFAFVCFCLLLACVCLFK